MKSKKMHPDAIVYFVGEYPVKLSKERQTTLLDSGYVSFEADHNSTDISKIITAIYNRDEIDLELSDFQDELIPTRIINFERMHKQSQDLWHCKFDLVRIRRLADLDNVEVEVIEERVKRTKDINDPADTKGYIRSYIPPMVKAMVFDHQFGLESSIELVNEHFYEIAEKYSLSENELRDLALYVSQRESEYLLKDETELNIFNEGAELNHQNVNDIRKLNRLRTQTNGKEYLPN